jgi:uncharacterized membrane protein
MPRFCSSCGAQVADTASFCPACGKPAAPVQPTAPSQGSAGAAPATAVAAASTGGLEDNVAGLLAYITIIPAILFLVMEPYNKKPFVRFHSFQCIFLHVAAIVVGIAAMILSAVLAFIPIFGHLVMLLIWPVIWLGFFVLWLVLLMKAYQGQMWKLPFIGDLAEKQANA